jgi:hypothetical protein
MQASIFSDIFAQIESIFSPNISETGFYDHNARVAAISTVDKGIDVAKQLVRSLLIRRNTLAPISLLPPEILARVFRFLVLEEPPLSRRGNLGWIKVTHVCRHWRQVAIDDSSLWSKIWGIPMTNKWVPEILARTRNAPLDIGLNVDAMSTSPEALLVVLPHLSHTRQIRFHGLYTRHSGRVQEIYSSEAPALEHFELEAYSAITFPDLGGNMLFKGHAPKLRTFSLYEVVIPWSLIPRGHLTQLKIAGPKEDVHSPGDLNQLTDLLVNCPELEILVLESCLPSQLTEFTHGRTIHLPHLSRLRLSGSTSRIMNMLKMLKLPSSIKLHLNCISNTTHNNSEDLLLPVISAQFQSPTPVEFKSLTVSIRLHMTSSLTITASIFPSTLQNRLTQNIEGGIVNIPELVLSFASLSKPGDLLKQACKMLPISNLEFISISDTAVVDVNWVELFSCCTNVTTLQATGHGTGSLVRAFTAPTATNAGSSKQGRKRKHDNRENTVVQPANTVAHTHIAIFPKLKFLGLSNLNFSGKQTSDISFDIFKRGLQQRTAASGEPLKLLRIRDCDISPQRAKDLRKLVQDFDWDEGVIRIDGLENFDEYERRLYDTGDVFVDRVTLLPGWDSEDDYTDLDQSDDYVEW